MNRGTRVVGVVGGGCTKFANELLCEERKSRNGRKTEDSEQSATLRDRVSLALIVVTTNRRILTITGS